MFSTPYPLSVENGGWARFLRLCHSHHHPPPPVQFMLTPHAKGTFIISIDVVLDATQTRKQKERLKPYSCIHVYAPSQALPCLVPFNVETMASAVQLSKCPLSTDPVHKATLDPASGPVILLAATFNELPCPPSSSVRGFTITVVSETPFELAAAAVGPTGEPVFDMGAVVPWSGRPAFSSLTINIPTGWSKTSSGGFVSPNGTDYAVLPANLAACAEGLPPG